MTDAAQPTRVYVGGYTAEMDGRSVGIESYLTTLAPDEQITLEPILPVTLTSASFLVKHPDKGLVFAVGESTPGTVTSLRIEPDGHLDPLGTVESGGDGGCHLAVDPSGKFVVVAHYTSGSVASFAIEEDGTLTACDVLAFEGSGPDAERQDAAHAHQVVSVGDMLLVPDLGSDALRLVSLADDGTLGEAADPIRLPPGTGPRHLVVSQDHVVVACELTAQVWVKSLATDLSAPGTLVASSNVDPDEGERIYPSAIVALGDHVVVANRGVDTLAVFSLDPDTSEVQLVNEVSTAGRWPRDMTLVDDRLWVANQAEDLISVFDVSDGAWFLRLEAQLSSPSPACVLLV